MVTPLPITKIHLEPGSKVTIPGVSWQTFENILEEFGETRNAHFAYSQETLEIMVPLTEHERTVVMISDLVKIILRLQNRPWESLRSSTFRHPLMAVGIEPDDCFYIQNYQAVIGKNRLDLKVDPPPDLAIEVDFTSKTKIIAYEGLQVSEIWVYSNHQLQIFCLNSGQYQEVQNSLSFPNLPLQTLIPEILTQTDRLGMSQTLQLFEERIHSFINPV